MNKIVDLKGSIWFLNEHPAFNWSNWYNIDFESNGEQFVAMSDKLSENSTAHNAVLKYFYANGQYVSVIDGGTEEWTNKNYRTIKITGGDAATNADFIALMYEMGTLISGGVWLYPTVTFDPSTLNLSVGTHSITVKARADGYADSAESSAVSVNIITFSINETEYRAQEGMTWDEWCNSSYNTDEYYVETWGVVSTKNGIYIQLNSSYEYRYYVIADGAEYTYSLSHSGGNN